MKTVKVIKRFNTRTVKIGDIPLGYEYPIRLQSMTTTDSMDTEATAKQCIRIIKAGAEYVRITAPSINEAKNLENIKKKLRENGYHTPLIADIHFTPNAAETAARIVEKVRINPGNYADKKRFNVIEYSEAEYNNELERIREKLLPLITICKEYGTAVRIGTNHGSLSDRIMSRYGDTPLGMVESAMEFARIFVGEGFTSLVFSMKASNPKVMIDSNRLLVDYMEKEEMNFPIHLGVTEAGDGEDGRIKSAIGIGTLLEEGIGDTIRVSLTEEPEYEIPVCKTLTARYAETNCDEINKSRIDLKKNQIPIQTQPVINIGGSNPPVVIVDLNEDFISNIENFKQIGYLYSEVLDKWTISDISPDYLYCASQKIDYNLPGTLNIIYDYNYWITLPSEKRRKSFPLINQENLNKIKDISDVCNFIFINNFDVSDSLHTFIKEVKNVVLISEINKKTILKDSLSLIDELRRKVPALPVIFQLNYEGAKVEEWILYSSIDAGGLLVEGMGEGIRIISDNAKKSNEISFGILQAVRRRISKTEYISCPSCGRTLFDLQETTSKIRMKTSHLKGVKIAVMGCIVNGPGEMADADFGYVGSGPGKITLYRGKEIVKKNIPSEFALDELIDLLKANNCWTEPN